MRKIISSILFLFLIFTPSPAHASSYPQGNFVLAGGQFRSTDEFDPFEKIDKIFFSSIIIPVKDGSINYSTIKPVDLESGSQHFIGTINLVLNGTYDKDTGAIDANFTQKMDITYERKSGYGIREGGGESVFSGKAKGTVIDNQIVLSFEGKLSSKSSSETDSKKVETSSNTDLPWFKKVAFGTSDWVELEENVSPADEGEPAVDSGTRASDLSGQVEIACPPDLEAWDVMKMGRVIYVNCHIKTGEDSHAVLSFSDMTTFKLKPESEIVIDTPPQKDSKVKLLAGNIWSNVKKMIKDGTMEVHGSQAVAGIKGTTFVFEEDGATSTLKVIEGVVAFRSSVNGDEKIVNHGEMISATSVGLGEIKKFDIPAENLNWEKSDPENNVVKVETEKSNYLFPALALVFIIIILGLILKKRKHSNP